MYKYCVCKGSQCLANDQQRGGAFPPGIVLPFTTGVPEKETAFPQGPLVDDKNLLTTSIVFNDIKNIVKYTLYMAVNMKYGSGRIMSWSAAMPGCYLACQMTSLHTPQFVRLCFSFYFKYSMVLNAGEID